MRPFDYVRAGTVEEALRHLGAPRDGAGDAASGWAAPRLLAGGTDLLPLMKGGVTGAGLLVDVKRAAGLGREIEETAKGITVGALTTLADIERSALLRERATALVEAAAEAATPQLRNMATLGGNLLQRPRCWYFRNARFRCWLKGGDDCPARRGENAFHAVFGEGPCHAVHPSDPATALVALDARVRLRGPGGARTLPVEDFFAPPEEGRRTETLLAGDEIVESLLIPSLPPGARSTYVKAMDRKAWAFALVGVAAVALLEGGRIAGARIVLGGVATVPRRAREAERVLLGAVRGPDVLASAAEAALEAARPLEHNGYKVPLARALIRRALAAVTEAPAT